MTLKFYYKKIPKLVSNGLFFSDLSPSPSLFSRIDAVDELFIKYTIVVIDITANNIKIVNIIPILLYSMIISLNPLLTLVIPSKKK